MNSDILLRIALVALFVLFFVVRAYHNRRAETMGGEIEYHEPNRFFIDAMRAAGGLIVLGTLALYFVKPAWVAWASLPLPAWLRWAGLALGYLSLPLVWWTERTLGLNFNTRLHLRDGHTLITKGPYRWVRHPMYTALGLFAASWLPASANWLIGLPGILALVVILANRVRQEEALMLARFGDEYRRYMQRTGRFFPRMSTGR